MSLKCFTLTCLNGTDNLDLIVLSLSIKEFTFEIEFLNGVLCYAKSLQSCLTLCDPVGCSLFNSSVQGDSIEKYWSGLPCPPPGDLPYPGIEPGSLKSPALAGRLSGSWMNIYDNIIDL